MKKRYLIPSLLLLSSTALTSCGSSGGLVANGRRYMQGETANVNPNLMAQKYDSVRNMTEKFELSFSEKESYRGQSASVSGKLNGSVRIDFDTQALNGNFNYSISYGGAYKSVYKNESDRISFTASLSTGYISISSQQSGNVSVDLSSLQTLFDQSSYNMYSWNCNLDSDQINQYVDMLSDEISGLFSNTQVSGIVESFISSFVISGNPQSGTFDVGLGRTFVMNYTVSESSYSQIQYQLTINKMKVSYQDCLLKSAVAGFKLTGKQSGATLTASADLNISCSYNTNGGQTNQFNPANPFGN